jgi:hypothetical protein
MYRANLREYLPPRAVAEIERALAESNRLAEYTVATLPDAGVNIRMLAYVSNESGGAVPAFSDGTNWRRLTDRAIVS